MRRRRELRTEEKRLRNNSLVNKVAVVTGASRGIGRAIVRCIAAEGADCVFTYTRDRSSAESLTEEVSRLGRRAISRQLDCRDFEGAKTLIEEVKKEFGRLDILVNNAGITKDKSLMMMAREDWADVIDTNLTGVFNTTRAAIITFLKQKSGIILNIASVSGIHPLAGQVNYAAAKAGVIGFTKSLAKEVAPYNIRVNALAPGFIDTDMTSALGETKRQKLVDSVIPLKRFGNVEEVARTAVFLLTEASRLYYGPDHTGRRRDGNVRQTRFSFVIEHW